MEQFDRKFALWGFPFQVVLITAFLMRTMFFLGTSNPPIVILVLDVIGMAMFGWCLYNLYFRNKRLTGLVTTGVFKYTRHPMYTGLVLMDLGLWFVGEYNLFFLVSAALMYISMFIAAYLQENETIARFGDEAVEYYGRTPALIVMYPFCRH